MNIAVIGGGINGIMTAWELVSQGHRVTLFEKGEVMQQTSSASSKLLHGGLRYLENFEFRLVKEALNERQMWMNKAINLSSPIKSSKYSYSECKSKPKAHKFSQSSNQF